MVKFNNFSRPLSVFQVLFKANLNFKDFSRQPCIFQVLFKPVGTLLYLPKLTIYKEAMIQPGQILRFRFVFNTSGGVTIAYDIAMVTEVGIAHWTLPNVQLNLVHLERTPCEHSEESLFLWIQKVRTATWTPAKS